MAWDRKGVQNGRKQTQSRTVAMYDMGSERRSEWAKTDTAKRKREAGPDILNPQIRALGVMNEALYVDNTIQRSTKGQEDWQTNLATMSRQCPICNGWNYRNGVLLT